MADMADTGTSPAEMTAGVAGLSIDVRTDGIGVAAYMMTDCVELTH